MSFFKTRRQIGGIVSPSGQIEARGGKEGTVFLSPPFSQNAATGKRAVSVLAEPELSYPESNALQSTRPSGSGSLAFTEQATGTLVLL